jgi:repressor LexA
MDKIFAPIKERVIQFVDYKRIKKEDFFKISDISASNFKGKGAESELGGDKVVKILTSYPEINPEWLLIGKGEMLKSEKKVIEAPSPSHGIPLVGIEAFGGLGSLDMAISEQDIQARYVIPDFERSDFMLRVTGNSMSPTYNSGDVVACKLIQESNFIQWGRPHIIGTRDQGIMIKRLKPGPDKDTYMAVSDNNNYEPFHLPVSQITSIALVTGMIRIE